MGTGRGENICKRLILTYRRTLVLHYLLQSRGVYTVLLYIFIKQRNAQTFWDIIHVCQAILETGSGRKLSHNGCTAGNFDLPDHGFLLLTWSTGPMEWSTGNSYQADALTNVLRYHICRSSQPEGRKLPITELKWDARTLTDIPGITAYWFLAFFWLTEGSRNKN
jgi:hypothetical protein